MRDDDIIGYRCPACKMLNAKNVKYCVECGHWLLDTTFPAEVVIKSDYLKQITGQSANNTGKPLNTSTLKTNIINRDIISIVIFIALLVLISVLKINFGDELKNHILASNSSKNSSSISAPKFFNSFNQATQPLPENGQIWQYTKSESIAPLGIITKSNDTNFFIKVNDWNTKQTVLEIFIRAGQAINTKIPLGSYEIKYASGKTWYGKQYCFGPETSYNKADQKFDFFKTENSILGHNLELYQRIDGNLKTEHISPNEF